MASPRCAMIPAIRAAYCDEFRVTGMPRVEKLRVDHVRHADATEVAIRERLRRRHRRDRISSVSPPSTTSKRWPFVLRPNEDDSSLRPDAFSEAMVGASVSPYGQRTPNVCDSSADMMFVQSVARSVPPSAPAESAWFATYASLVPLSVTDADSHEEWPLICAARSVTFMSV